MENTLNPLNEGLEDTQPNHEQKTELAVFPIFRSNDLYDAMFPEINPVCEKGEEPNVAKIFEEILKHPNSAIAVDMTCYNAIEEELFNAISKKDENALQSFPKELGLSEAVAEGGKVRMEILPTLLKEKFNIDFSFDEDVLIETRVEQMLGGRFSVEVVKTLLNIAKEKNSDIKEVYLLSENITDHTGSEFPKEEILPTWQKEIETELGIEAKVVPTLTERDIKEGDLFIVNRHNPAISNLDLAKKFPKQVLLLPLESELRNNEQTGQSVAGDGVTKMLRAAFEKNAE